jgi:hypothetical protein
MYLEKNCWNSCIKRDGMIWEIKALRVILPEKLLKWIAGEQYRGKSITTKKIGEWAKKILYPTRLMLLLLLLLHERFMVINRDVKKGDYSIFPSLAEFT